jgi:hypothetical protein
VAKSVEVMKLLIVFRSALWARRAALAVGGSWDSSSAARLEK